MQKAESRVQKAESGGRYRSRQSTRESSAYFLPSAFCLLLSGELVSALFNFHQTTIERRAAAHIGEAIGGERVHVETVWR